jgi:hypothetical protein
MPSRLRSSQSSAAASASRRSRAWARSSAEAAAVEFTLDAGFGGGVEGQAHGESISLWGRREFPILPNPEDPDCGNLYRNLKFPEAVYEHIGQYQEEKIRAGE